MQKWIVFLFSLALISCEMDSYEKGEGEYSLMIADFADMTIDAQKQGVSFVTDDGDNYRFSKPYTAKWIETADTTYRTIIYYNKVENAQADVVSAGTVPTLKPREHWKMKETPEDPVGFESAWLAKSGKYLNMGLLFKTGRVDDEEGIHSIGMAQDTVLVNADQTRTAYYRFLHAQGDTPEYYTNRKYISVLLPEDRPDSIHLTITTYQGVIVRKFPL